MILRGLIAGLFTLLAPSYLPAVESRPRAILVLDQSDMRGAFYHQVFSAFQAEVESQSPSRLTVYAEDLDLEHFGGADYEAGLRQTLSAKYRDTPIGVVVVVGECALRLALAWRDELWPGIPVVFTMVNQADFGRLKLPADVTGSIVDVKLADSIKAARAVVPDLASVFIVGDAWDRQIAFRNWKGEIASIAGELRVVELIDLPLAELRERVSDLPERSAIIYSSVHSDGKGTPLRSGAALARIAEKANRPIVVASDTLLSRGGIGGFVLVPSVIGAEAGRLALRILDGEAAADIPPKVTEAVAPIFNWRQMERWNVVAANLPPRSAIWFRELSLTERYRWQTLAIIAVILIQTALISILLHERKLRSKAEREVRQRFAEFAHVSRRAAAGELSSSIAHELSQPLGAILTNAETAELILKSPSPDLVELKDIVADIKRDDERASEVILRVRSFLKRSPFELKDLDLNNIMREAFELLALQATSSNVALYFTAYPEALPIRGDAVQLQQVILNLIVNGIEAMSSMPYGRAIVGRVDRNGGSSAVVSISDLGPGIPPERFNEIFDPFFTTKQQGMGIGLSISRTIIQAHKGRIWAENQAEGGAVFRLSLPLAPH